MSVEKIPENGRRINKERFKLLLDDVLSNARQYHPGNGSMISGYNVCVFCDADWDSPDDAVVHSTDCAYVIALEYLKEFYQ